MSLARFALTNHFGACPFQSRNVSQNRIKHGKRQNERGLSVTALDQFKRPSDIIRYFATPVTFPRPCYLDRFLHDCKLANTVYSLNIID